MVSSVSELWNEIASRSGGPFGFRFYLQPLMAILCATRDGVRDARTGRPAYLWSLFTDRAGRRQRLRDGWRSVGKIFVLAIVLDLLYQVFVLKGFRPVQGLLVAVALALVPYVLLRGPVSRIFRRLGHTRALAR